MKEDTRLPAYLDNFMSYVNYLRDKYKSKSKYFLVANFEINNKKQVYYFGINDKNLMFATSSAGGDSIALSKEQSEVIYTASYLCATHSELYRNLIEDTTDFWELSHDQDDKELFGLVKNEIKQVLKTHDPRTKPMF